MAVFIEKPGLNCKLNCHCLHFEISNMYLMSYSILINSLVLDGLICVIDYKVFIDKLTIYCIHIEMLA